MEPISIRSKPTEGPNKEIWVKVPKLKRSHCDMSWFRSHKKYGSYANSVLFPDMLERIKEDIGNYIKFSENAQEGDEVLGGAIKLVRKGFLWSVSINPDLIPKK